MSISTNTSTPFPKFLRKSLAINVYQFHQKSVSKLYLETLTKAPTLQLFTAVDGTKNKFFRKGCVEEGFEPCKLTYEGNDSEKRDHCMTCKSDLCNSGSMMGSAVGLLVAVLVALRVTL